MGPIYTICIQQMDKISIVGLQEIHEMTFVENFHNKINTSNNA
jgi:hypothetical protein